MINVVLAIVSVISVFLFIIYIACFDELSKTIFRKNRFSKYESEKYIVKSLYDNISVLIYGICNHLVNDSNTLLYHKDISIIYDIDDDNIDDDVFDIKLNIDSETYLISVYHNKFFINKINKNNVLNAQKDRKTILYILDIFVDKLSNIEDVDTLDKLSLLKYICMNRKDYYEEYTYYY